MVPNDPGEAGGSESVFDLGGRSRRTLELIADKWAVLILYALSRGTIRHNQLHRDIGGISQKMLTKTLRRLERDGLVGREAFPEIPPPGGVLADAPRRDLDRDTRRVVRVGRGLHRGGGDSEKRVRRAYQRRGIVRTAVYMRHGKESLTDDRRTRLLSPSAVKRTGAATAQPRRRLCLREEDLIWKEEYLRIVFG